MGVTLYCFVFGVVSLRTVDNMSVVLSLSGFCVSQVKPEALFFTFSLSLSSQCPFMDERILGLHQKIRMQPVVIPQQ